MHGGGQSWWRYAPMIAILAGLALAYALRIQDYLSIDYVYGRRTALKYLVADNLALALAVFFLFYTVAITLVFPAPVILTIAAGFLFGWWIGGLVSIAAATLGGSLLFLAARSAFGDILRRRAGHGLQRFAEGFRRDAFTYLLVLRLTPIFPVAALNIGPAFLDISLRSFALATFLGIIPGAMVYAFLGSGLDRALKIAGKYDHIAISDLMTIELTVALVGLTSLSLLGVVLKTWLLRPRPSDEAPVADGGAKRPEGP